MDPRRIILGFFCVISTRESSVVDVMVDTERRFAFMCPSCKPSLILVVILNGVCAIVSASAISSAVFAPSGLISEKLFKLSQKGRFCDKKSRANAIADSVSVAVKVAAI